MREDFLAIHEIRKSFGAGDSKVEVLKGIDLDIAQGEFCVLLGPSGSGKSTLLNIIGGIDRPDSGEIIVNGERMADMKEKKLTIQKLADLTGLADETIKNLRNDPERRFQIEDIVAVCIALHLSPETSDAYIKASPSKFLGTDDMLLYQYALKEWYKLDLAVFFGTFGHMWLPFVIIGLLFGRGYRRFW